MDISPLDRHAKIVLQFSGGKDSIACLLLLREHLDRMVVVWMNPGDALPEHRAQMALVRAFCPHFIEVGGDRDAQVAQYGYPVDVLPIRNSVRAQYLIGHDRPRLQSFMECCQENMLIPMQRAMQQMGATLIIRGQKNADASKSPVRSGDVVEGVEYWFPIQEWDDAQVLDFIGDSDLLPAHFEHGQTSLECWSCTAYMQDHKWKLPYLDQHHQDKAAEVRRRLIAIKKEVFADMQHLEG